MAKNTQKAIPVVDHAANQKTEAVLRQSVKDLSAYKYAVDQSCIVSITDTKGIISHVNDNFCKISKYSREELTGQDHRIINSSYHSRQFINDLWTTIASGKIWKGELKNKAKDGSYYWLDTTIVPCLNEEGKPYQYIAIRSDITQQKHEEERLRLLDSVIINAKDAVLITGAFPIDLPGPVILYVNEAFTKMTGYTPEEVIGKTPRILQGPKSDRDELKHVSEALHKFQPCETTIINYKKNGEEFWINFSISPVIDDKGITTHFIAIEKDITLLKNEQLQKLALSKAITDSLKERNTILESIDDAFFAVDKDWTVTYWNKSAERVLSKKKAEVMNNNLWEVFSTEVGDMSYRQYHIAVDTNKAVHFEDNYAALNKWYEISAYPTGNGLSVYFKDITARKLADLHLKHLNLNLQKQARELEVSNAELEQFAYVASHDLQEPLRMVTSFLTQIEKKYGTILDAKGRQYIHFAVDGARRMRQIILDLLEFSRVGRVDDTYEEVDLKNILDDILALYRKQITEQKAVFMIGDLPVIQTLKVPLRQVFQNLISNSLKYQIKGVSPLINISCTEHKKYWLFRISDNGIGIAPEYFDKIFIIFQRLHNRDEYSGTGMGLAVTKKIIENLGGKIYLESQEGKGTTFYFTLLKR